MVWIIFDPKTFESEKRFMHESFLRFLRVGVCWGMLQPEFVPPVTSLIGLDSTFLWKYHEQCFAVFSTSRPYIQQKLSPVTFIVSFYILLSINQYYVDKNKSMTIPLSGILCFVNILFLQMNAVTLTRRHYAHPWNVVFIL